jgi:hypothetical protein
MATTRAPARVAAVLRGTDSAERLDGAVALAERAGVPVTLAIDAETAVGATRGRPELLDRLRAAFATGVLRPLLTTAHRAEAALLSAEELADELRLDEEALQLVLGVTAERRGFDGAAATWRRWRRRGSTSSSARATRHVASASGWWRCPRCRWMRRRSTRRRRGWRRWSAAVRGWWAPMRGRRS